MSGWLLTDSIFVADILLLIRHLGYERVYLPLCQVADTPFHIQGDELWRKNTISVAITPATIVL